MGHWTHNGKKIQWTECERQCTKKINRLGFFGIQPGTICWWIYFFISRDFQCTVFDPKNSNYTKRTFIRMFSVINVNIYRPICNDFFFQNRVPQWTGLLTKVQKPRAIQISEYLKASPTSTEYTCCLFILTKHAQIFQL